MKTHSRFIILGTLASAWAALSAIGIYIFVAHPGYWPTISEAGAFSNSYKHYSVGMTVGATAFGIALAILNGELFSSLFVRVINYALIGVMSCAMAYQGIVKIQLDLPTDSHRTAAGIFFSLAFLLCLLFGSHLRRSLFQRVCFVGFIVLVIFAIASTLLIFRHFDIAMSITLDVQAMNPEMMSAFAYAQYVLVLGLFFGLASCFE